LELGPVLIFPFFVFMVSDYASSLIAAQLVKKSPVFYGIRRFIAVIKEPASGTYLSQLNPVHTFKVYSVGSISVLSFHPGPVIPSCIFPYGFPTNSRYGSYL
jgi:hypothetical protein